MEIDGIVSNPVAPNQGAGPVQKVSPKTDLAKMIERLIEAKDQDGTGALCMDELGIQCDYMVMTNPRDLSYDFLEEDRLPIPYLSLLSAQLAAEHDARSSSPGGSTT